MDRKMDQSLETAIDDVGRDRVFSIVRAAGWRVGDSIPKYVWQDAVRMARLYAKGGDAE